MARRMAVLVALVVWVVAVAYLALAGRGSPQPERSGATVSVLSVATDPPGASVRLVSPGAAAAFARGTTPCDLPVAPRGEDNPAVLHIDMPGYLSQRRPLDLSTGQSQTVAVALQPMENWEPVPERTPSHAVTIAAVGDILLGQVLDPFGDVGDLLRSADVTFGNLECALTTHGAHTPGKTDAQIAAQEEFVFKAHPRWSNALSLAGFDVVSMANNHAMDYRGEGLVESVDSLSRLGVKVVGAGPNLGYARSRREVTVGKVKVGFLAVTTIVPYYSAAGESSPGVAAHPVGPMSGWLRTAISGAASSVDVLCVSFHWGIERQPMPAEYQRALAREAVAAGADFVIGHHPHCLQPVEVMDGALVVYMELARPRGVPYDVGECHLGGPHAGRQVEQGLDRQRRPALGGAVVRRDVLPGRGPLGDPVARRPRPHQVREAHVIVRLVEPQAGGWEDGRYPHRLHAGHTPSSVRAFSSEPSRYTVIPLHPRLY
ncbi:MAG: CapA family protein, partial [Acidobacteriota bacterium]|nr:CapA family protein [Acidobacteriota bacterium]